MKRPKLTVDRRPDGTMLIKSPPPGDRSAGCVHDWLFLWAKRTPQRTFLSERVEGAEKWRDISYGDAAVRVRAIANAIAAMTIDDDRPLLILSGNSIRHQLVSLAAMTAGVAFSPISSAYSTMEGAVGKLRHVVEVLDPGVVYAEDGEQYGRALMTDVMAGRKLIVGRNAQCVPGALLLDSLERSGPTNVRGYRDRPTTQDTIAKFIFTSGSTGTPKGVITTHRMIRADVEAISACILSKSKPFVAVDWLPWSHVYGGSFGVGSALHHGGTLFIDDGRPIGAEYSRTVENLAGISPTVYWNVPKAFEFLVRELQQNETLCRSFFSELEVMIYGAASLPPAVLNGMNLLVEKYAERPIPMLAAWGMTETTTIASIASAPAIVPNAIGLPLPGTELKLVPNGDKLEARVRGDIVTPGYWKMDSATSDAFDEEGYFKTGDAMRLFDDKRPELGLVFEGRVAEDFKLLTGTWVNVTEIRSRCMSFLGGLATDVVVAGPDRDELALLIFPSLGSMVEEDSRVSRMLEALRHINDGVSGSSRIIARAIVVDDPPVASLGEVTEKGSLNSRVILQQRSDFIDGIYRNGNPAVMILGSLQNQIEK